MSSKTLSAPSLNDLDLHSVPDNVNRLPKHGGRELQQAKDAFQFVDKEGFSLFKSPFSGEPLGAREFVPSIHRTRSQDSEHWKYEPDGSMDTRIGLIRNSQILTGSYNVPGKAVIGDKLGGYGKTSVAPQWHETGDAVGNIFVYILQNFLHLVTHLCGMPFPLLPFIF